MDDTDINSDVELGLMPGFDPLGVDSLKDDTLIDPPTANETKVAPTVITDVAQNTPSQMTTPNDFFGDNYVLGEVPDLESKIKVIDSSKEAIDEITFAKESLTRAKGISQADYQSIQPLIKDRVSVGVEEFSKIRTQTHYRFIMESLERELELHKQTVTCTYESIYDETLEDLEEFVDHFERHYLPFIKENISKVNEGFGEILESLLSSKNVFVFNTQQELVNLRECTILDSPVLDELVESSHQWHQGLKIIRTSISIPALAHFIWTVNTDREGHYHLYSQTAAEGIAYSKEMTIKDLIDFYLNGERVLFLLNEMLVESQSCITELSAMKETLHGADETIVRTHAFDNSDRLVHISTSFMYNKAVCDNLGLLNNALVHCHEVLQYLSKS